jgi:hypothetical protein
MTKTLVPLEDVEDEIFANYLRVKGYLFSHIANETSIKNWGYLRKMKRIGKNAGVPDFLVIVPRGQNPMWGFRNVDRLCFVEMKRKNATACNTSEIQQSWIDALNACGTLARVCRGADEAIKFIEQISKGEI